MPDRLPTGFLGRATATGRAAAHLGRAAARRLVRRSEEDDARLGDALVGELDRLKGLAMKVGQILSYMEVGLPEETARRLVRLQKGADPLPLDAIRGIVEAELGAPLGELFDAFDPVPAAAASVGQVHRAVLGGLPVAVKVRYPGVCETLAADALQLRGIARIASLATAVDGDALVAELRDRLLEECDYVQEARNQELFRGILAGDPDLVVPRVVSDRCGPGVLTTAWHDGAPLEALIAAGPERKSRAAAALARLFWDGLLRHGILHADPHPGNFLFPEGGGVVVLDFGCVRRFDSGFVAGFRDLASAVLDGDPQGAFAAASALGLTPRPERLDREELWAMLSWMFDPYRAEIYRSDRVRWEEGMRRFSGPGARNARHLGFPPAWLWVQRGLVGLHAVLLRLGVEAPLAAVARSALRVSSPAEGEGAQSVHRP